MSGFLDSSFGTAIALGAFVVGVYFVATRFGGAHNNNPQQIAAHMSPHGSRQGSQAAPGGAGGNNPIAAGAAAATVQQQQHQAAAAAQLAKANLPSRTDDLEKLINAGRSRNWSIILHTRSGFSSATVPLSSLRDICKSYPNLLLCHQLFTESDAAKETELIKQNVDTNTFARQRLLLCTTDKGPEAISRQVEPVMLISDNRQLLNFMSAFVTFCVQVKADATERLTVEPLLPAGASGGSRTTGAAASVCKIHVVQSVSTVLPSLM